LAGVGVSFGIVRLKAQSEVAPIYGLGALVDGTGMVRVPAGEFLMGSDAGNADESPVHRVRISRPFEIGKYEVTQLQWETVMSEAHPKPGVDLVNTQGATVSRTPSHFRGPSQPVDSVSWDDIELFLNRLNARDPKHAYRLPTEAEWECAARAGAKQDRVANLDAVAWHDSNSSEQTQVVGQKQANASGLYDTLGNVAEWVNDWYGYEYYDQTPLRDPAGPRTGSYRVYRGGSWLAAAKDCTVTHRGFEFPVSRLYNVGFRVVRTAK
jgi:formylglycine-generating enzyme required for sulfatase activity